MENEVAVINNNMSVQSVKQQFDVVNDLYKQIMIQDEHFGKIPGTKKDTLFKAGAEKLNILFKLVPKIEKENKVDLGNGHREIEMTIGLYHRETEKFWGQGTGSCSTMESKFRYRSGDNFEVTEEAIPKDAKEKKAEYRKQGYGMKKVDGVWAWVKYLSEDKVENPDIADVYNTVRKMAYKRALVSATITATGVSDIFTQDVEDFKQPEKPEYIPPAETRLQAINQENTKEVERKKQAKEQYDKFWNSLDDGYKFELKDMTEKDRFILFNKCGFNIKKLDDEITKTAKENAEDSPFKNNDENIPF
jgi:hypothetical protein